MCWRTASAPRRSNVKPAISSAPAADAAPVLLEVDDLSAGYEVAQGRVAALNRVPLTLRRGEVLGVVGESGSGKSTLANAVIGYRGPGMVVTSGRVRFDGILLFEVREATLRSLWGRRIAMVHQNPLATLTPTMPVGAQI